MGRKLFLKIVYVIRVFDSYFKCKKDCTGMVETSGYENTRIRSSRKQSNFTKEQEACRKDVENAFGVLQARFVVFWFPALAWSQEHIWEVKNACVILHNMIIKSERDEPVLDESESAQPYFR
uniref:Uncharacterized protein n=1 Tax=Avena sativa TaxID=4498 RepID=A0ACD5TR78_AVESA